MTVRAHEICVHFVALSDVLDTSDEFGQTLFFAIFSLYKMVLTDFLGESAQFKLLFLAFYTSLINLKVFTAIFMSNCLFH